MKSKLTPEGHEMISVVLWASDARGVAYGALFPNSIITIPSNNLSRLMICQATTIYADYPYYTLGLAMEVIQSKQNLRLRPGKKLATTKGRKRGSTLIEGTHLVEEAHKSGVRHLNVTTPDYDLGQDLPDRALNALVLVSLSS